ncbi:MAG: CBS domain-containing protein [Methanosphaera sp.]|uniref:magnesium transporter MgtE N-terminal domain-containing protein n=1 Tax=Methanosphaera sp. TaxID=2666342 RepID=UPI0025D788E1|nr:CBS domain-containing protein [Methanosphaera sp.]MCI5866759.1 CBS domain-containing protein [Methanosphaera sp.]MDD6534273.1 CBS domain-containing protein [Methanosphaera sp.]MDY3956342.1 CBS domain-containing protein [Methanosphaera sp.]
MYLSELLNKKVVSDEDEKYGKVKDIVISSDRTYPKIEALKIKANGEPYFIPSRYIKKITPKKVILTHNIEDIKQYPKQDSVIKLSRDILDRQVVDMEGSKIRRVNDVEISYKNGNYFIIGVDIGINGLFRRLGLEAVSKRLHPENNIISWKDIDSLDFSNLKLNVPKEKLTKLHPADIAEIVDNLGISDSISILNSLDDESAADAFEEISPEKQRTLLTEMEKKQAADLIDEMSPDDAADLLASISDEKKEEILRLMDPEESHELRELLEYPENTAGGIMTTEYASIKGNMTTFDVLQRIRKIADDVETIYYIYILSEDDLLKGVITMRELLLAEDDVPIYSYMNKDVISANTNEEQDEVARMIAKYNLIAIPVVDDDNIMKGIVTVDDAIDIILPTAWKKRIPKMFR